MKEKHSQKIFGQIIQKLRKEAGLTQEDLAGLAEINRTYIGDIERGARNIALANILKIATALNIEASKIFELMEKSKKEHSK